jgi:hypothetical protein
MGNIDEARNYHHRYASGLCAQCAIETVFDRHASLRFDTECRRSIKVGGRRWAAVACFFRQRTALRMPTSFSLQLCRAV